MEIIMNIDLDDIANLFNYIWPGPPIKEICGLSLSAIADKVGHKIICYEANKIEWTLKFVFQHRTYQRAPFQAVFDQEVFDYINIKRTQYAMYPGKIIDITVEGNTESFIRDWIILKLYDHIWK